MAAKRKQDDKHLKLLRELGAKSDNKKCFDCEQRGPTYVNMTVGSFVCTRCSGILRGLNPPHRVKSISMTSFTIQEIEFLEKHGNELCRQVWLGLESSRGSSLESKDEQKVRDYMVQKYERKRWYVPPNQVKLTNSSSNSTPEAQPLKKLVSNESPKTTLSSSSSSPPTSKVQVAPKISIPMPGAVPGPALQASAKPASSASGHHQHNLSETRQPSMDLLGDLGGDPFSQPQQQQQQAAPAAAAAPAGGFANFGQAFSSQPAQGTQPVAFDPFGAPSTFASSSSFGAFGQATSQPSTNVNAFGSAAPAQPSGSFNAFGTATAPAQPATTGFAAFGAAPMPTPATGANASVGQTAQSLRNLSLTTSASSTASQPASSSTDKYAIFSSLATDGSGGGAVGSGAASTGSSINWSSGGSSTSANIDWTGGSSSKGGSSSLLSGGGIDWGPGSNTNIKQPTTSGLGLMSSSMTSGPNPFGGQVSATTGLGQTNTQPVYTSSMGGFGSQPAPQTSGFGVFPTSQGVPGAMGTTGSMMNGGFNQMQQQQQQPQPGGLHAQGGFGGMAPMQAGTGTGQMGTGVPGAGGMGSGFGMQPQQAFPTAGASMGGMKAGFGGGGAATGAGQGFGPTGQAGFGGAMQGGFGAQTQPGMNMAQPMGMAPVGGAQFAAQGTMGQPQNATGAMSFGTHPQAMPAGAGGWPQQQSNPFMGQSDGFASQQQQPAQRSTNPFM